MFYNPQRSDFLTQCSPDINNVDNDEVYYEVIHDTLQQLDLIQRLTTRFPNRLKQVFAAAEVWKIYAESAAISSFTGAEGLHRIGNSASILRMYHTIGMRYITLTHDCHNKYADSAAPLEPHHGGLPKAGVLLLQEMNRIGMMIDLSRTSVATMYDALNTSKGPVIFSHLSNYTSCNHPRNVPDVCAAGTKVKWRSGYGDVLP